MPTSNPAQISHVAQRILALRPRSVLDVGIGFGKYGLLAREYTEVYGCGAPNAEYAVRRTQVDGIEIFEPYVQDLQRMIYDEIMIGDACEIMTTLNNYDLIICVDMLEHLEKERGKEFLVDMKKVGRVSIVIVPIVPPSQGTMYGNPHEAHISMWEEEELSPFGEVIRILNHWVLEMLGGV